MQHEYVIEAGQAEEGLRVDVCLANHLPKNLSRTWIQRLIRQGSVTVNGVVIKANYKLKTADTILARCKDAPPQHEDQEPEPEQIPLDIMYEDASVLVVNKAVGLVTHPAPGHWDGTLVNAVLWHLRENTDHLAEDELPRAGIVHRLDKDTSGLLVIAKTPYAHQVLSKQLKDREMKREYLALVDGHPPMDEGKVDAPIARHPIKRKSMAVRQVGGRHAVTHYRVLKRYGVPYRNRHSALQHAGDQAEEIKQYTCALLAMRLETGRTHQIRVHLAHIGYPVAGDITYSKHPLSYWEKLGMHRQLLHAWRIRFLHPEKETWVEVVAPPPEDMRRWVTEDVINNLQSE